MGDTMSREKRIGTLWRRAALMGATAIVAAALSLSDAQANSVEEAVRAALQTNPDIGIVVENKRAVEFERHQAAAPFLPQLDLRAAAGYEINETETTRDNNSGSVHMPVYQSSLTLTQRLFDGWATDADVRRQEGRVISATRRVREVAEQIALDAIEAYFESLRQREVVALNEENVRVHQQTLELV